MKSRSLGTVDEGEILTLRRRRGPRPRGQGSSPEGFDEDILYDMRILYIFALCYCIFLCALPFWQTGGHPHERKICLFVEGS